MLSRSWNRKPITGFKGPIEWFSPQRLRGYYWAAVAMAELGCDDTISLKSHNQKYDTYHVCKEALYWYFSNLLVRVCFRPLTLNVILLQLQSWPKISAPLQFCQKMQPFSENCFGTHIYFFCLHLNNTKKQRRKVKSDTIPHRTQKMHWTKLLAPLT